MKDTINDPIATTLVLHQDFHHIRVDSYHDCDVSDYDPDMTGSVEVTIRGVTCRVPAVRYVCGTIETAPVVKAVTPVARPALGCLILSPGDKEEVVVWTRPEDAPMGANHFWLAFADDDSVVRIVRPWEINQTTPVYFLKAYRLLDERHLPLDHDDGDTIQRLLHERGRDALSDLMGPA